MGLLSAIRRAAGAFRTRRAGASATVKSAGGEAAPLPFLFALPWQEGRPMPARYSVADVPRRYAGWVYAAVRAIAQGCAACDVRFSETVRAADGSPRSQPARQPGRKGAGRQASGRNAPDRRRTLARPAGGSRPVLKDHPLARLFAEVNPFHTYRELVETTITDLELTGNAYWVLSRTRVSDVPAEIWPVPPAWMRVVPDGLERFVDRYELRRGARTWRFEPRDVVHFRYTSPGDPWYGRSPLEAALEAVLADESVSRAQRRAFELGVLPGVVLQSREPLTREQKERLRADFESCFAGPDAAGRMVITDPGAELYPFSVPPREMDFMESTRSTRDRILACFGVPPAVLGIVEDFNRANAEAAHAIFARNTVAPKLKMLAARITQDVCSQFLPDGITCEFDSPVPADREQDRREMETAVRLGVVSTNEARRTYLGRDAVEGGDALRPRVPVYELVPRGEEDG